MKPGVPNTTPAAVSTVPSAAREMPNRRGVDPADGPGRGDLLAESAQELGVAGQVRMDDLDGHRPAGRGEPEVDPAHAARAELGAQPVFADHARIVRGQCLHLSSPWGSPALHILRHTRRPSYRR